MHLRLSSSYQLDFAPELLSRYVDLSKTQRANVLLPITRRRKAPLLNFALAGPAGCPAALTSRASTAALQAQYLALLATTSKASRDLAAIPERMYEAIGVFTPGRFRDDFLDKAKGDHEKALAAYLQSGLGRPICADEVTRWRGLTADAGKVLAERLDEPPDLLSCSEEPLLAVPRLDPLPGSTADVDSLLKGYQAAVLAADREDDGFFLVALAEYGRRYDMIIEVEVPLLEPSTIKIEEDLPLELSWRNRMSHSFAFGDARSAHLEARVSDPAVEIADFDLHDLQDHDASGWIESVRQTREAVSIYSSEPGRPYFVRVRLRFRAARYLLVTTVLLALANVVALVAMLLVEQDGSYVDRLVVLSLPTTVAAAFVLIREQTALATRLQWPTRAFLAATTLAVWGVLVGMTVTYNAEADAGGPERPVDSTKSGGPALSKYHSMGKDQGTWPRTGHEVADE